MTDYFLRTGGKRERNAPEWLLGGRAQGNLGDFTLGVQAKYTGSRFMNDINGVVQEVPKLDDPTKTDLIAPAPSSRATRSSTSTSVTRSRAPASNIRTSS